MSILGIGVDVVHAPRIAGLMSRRGAQRLAARILSAEELRQWATLPPDDASIQTQFLAARWAIKEAAYKAVYPACRPTWKEFTYRPFSRESANAKPALIYRPTQQMQEHVPIDRLHLSVSHDGEYVFASVLAEGFSAE